MPLPDPYAGEPTTELDPDKVTLWLNAQDAADRWQEHADALKRELMENMGGAHAGLVPPPVEISVRPASMFG